MSRITDAMTSKTGYEEFRYVMQDTGNYYIGARFTYAECMEEDNVPFKFKAIIEHYLMKDTDVENSLESHLYYLKNDEFSYKTYIQLKARVKISVLTTKKNIFGKEKTIYEEKIVSISDLAEMNLARKKGSGVIIRELVLSKLALMSFSV